MPKKTIRDIFLKEKKARPLKEELGISDKRGGSRFSKAIIFICFLALMIAFGFVALSRLSMAEISITPHNEKINIDTKILAKRDAQDGLPFEIMRLEAEDSKIAIATGISVSSQKASGKITIYNNYGTSPQKLITNTRFESPDGKIYRIKDAVTVPGNGHIDATVYADKPGPGYNIVGGDFTIPGFKGGPRYSKIYAKSKEGMSGGSNGNSRIFKKEDVEGLRNEIKDNLKKQLVSSFSSKKPDGYLLLGNAIKIEYIEDSSSPKAGNDAKSDSSAVKIKGIGTGILVKRSDLEKDLIKVSAKNLNRPLDNPNLRIDNAESLVMDLISINDDSTQAVLRVNGEANFVWGFDKSKIASDLRVYEGKDYKEFFRRYPDIEKAETMFIPFWWRKMPSNSDRIKIKEVIF